MIGRLDTVYECYLAWALIGQNKFTVQVCKKMGVKLNHILICDNKKVFDENGRTCAS